MTGPDAAVVLLEAGSCPKLCRDGQKRSVNRQLRQRNQRHPAQHRHHKAAQLRAGAAVASEVAPGVGEGVVVVAAVDSSLSSPLPLDRFQVHR